MGCGSIPYTKIEGKLLKQEQIELDISNLNKNKELSQAQSLIKLITNIRNKIIYDYDKLIYSTAACIFKEPNIIHCTKCLFFIISAECKGSINSVEFSFKEDIPFFNLNMEKLSIETQNIIKELFEFVINLKNYRILIKKIDKETPKLTYIIFENSNNISKENLSKINRAISYFHDLSTFRANILVDYKEEIYDLIMSNSRYCEPINKIGQLASEKNIKDKYEIAFLINQMKNDDDFKKYFYKIDLTTYNNIKEAKNIMENKLSQEKFEEADFKLEKNLLINSQIIETTLSSSQKIRFINS